MKQTLYILDGMNLFFRALHACPPLSNSRGVPTGGVYGFARQLLAFVNEHRPTHLCVAMEGRGSFRRGIYAEYKRNRKPLDPDIISQMNLARAVVLALPLPTIAVPTLEADDVMAALALRAVREGWRAVVVTGDKDLHVLLAGGVELYDPRDRAYVTREAVIEKWGVPPERIPDLLSLTGDAVDNIPGVDGIGPGTAAKLLTKYETLDGVIANAAEVGGKRGASLRAAIEGGVVDLARRLVALRTDAELPRGPAELAIPPPDEEARRFLFTELEFLSLLPSDMPTAAEVRAARAAYDATGRPA